MVRKVSERVQAFLFMAVLIPAIAGLYAATQWMQPGAVQPFEVHSIHLEVIGDGWTIHHDPAVTVNNTAFSLLIEAGHELGFSVAYVPYEIPQGMFVTAINGSANGDGGRYWQYWVSGVYGDVAADHKALHDGDTVLWNFVPSVEGG